MITIIGGGPAGMSAALAAANAGAPVLLIESGPRLGGQYWRHLPENGLNPWEGQSALQSDYGAGFLLRNEVMSNPHIEVLCRAQVWSVTKDDSIHVNFLHDGVNHEVDTQRLILATGAYDRTLPFPGWDIPGVMTPGAAQSLLKGSHVLAGRKMVVAGTGPFLLPVASGLSKAGVEIVGLFEAHHLRKWISFSGVALRNLKKIFQGARYLSSLHQRTGYAVISAHAGTSGQLEFVKVAKVNSNFEIQRESIEEIPCDAAAIGWGFTPDLSIAQSLALNLVAGEDGFPVVEVDEYQCTSDPRVYAAGEITGIGGSELSLTEGAIAGKSAADSLMAVDRIITRKRIESDFKRRRKQRKFAKTLLKIYSVKPAWKSWLTDDTLICRCEEISLGVLKSSIRDLGATDARSAKLLTRVGMGACQGRICSRTAVEVIAGEHNKVAGLQDFISTGNRPVFSPITLGLLAKGSLPYQPL